MHASPMRLARRRQRRAAELQLNRAQRRALAPAPAVLLLDEPLSAMGTLVRTTTIDVTHDQAGVMAVADRFAVMNHGRLEQSTVGMAGGGAVRAGPGSRA